MVTFTVPIGKDIEVDFGPKKLGCQTVSFIRTSPTSTTLLPLNSKNYLKKKEEKSLCFTSIDSNSLPQGRRLFTKREKFNAVSG